MSWSLGEIRALTLKAARGAGMPWGLAEEAGFSVYWLEERGWPGVEAMAAYLENLSGYDGNNCPVAIGANVSDAGHWGNLFPTRLNQPILTVPFLSFVAGGGPLSLSWPEREVVVCPEGFSSTPSTDILCTEPQDCRIGEAGNALAKTSATVMRVPQDRQPFVSVLEKFAHNTYAPSTEESRAKGAGAGLTDND